MDRYSTRFEDKVSKRVTDVRVNIAPEARRELEKLVSDPKAMIQRCVWRFIWTKDQTNEIKGDEVEFTIDADQILELFADLRRIDMEEMPRRRAESSPEGAE